MKVYVVVKTYYYGENQTDERPLILGVFQKLDNAIERALQDYENKKQDNFIAFKEDLDNFKESCFLEVFYNQIENYRDYYTLVIEETELE